jgi:hypothetical protein
MIISLREAGGNPSIVMGEGLKRFTTGQTPSENSHSAIGKAPIAVSADTCGQRPNNTPRSETRSSGAPIPPRAE